MEINEFIIKNLRRLKIGTLVVFAGGHIFSSGLPDKEQFLLPEDHIYEESPTRGSLTRAQFSLAVSGSSTDGTSAQGTMNYTVSQSGLFTVMN